ncbi:hypothetical protein ACWEO2_03355 [Nocardia sp. NPDC004278]
MDNNLIECADFRSNHEATLEDGTDIPSATATPAFIARRLTICYSGVEEHPGEKSR